MLRAIHFAGIPRLVFGATAKGMALVLGRQPTGIPARKVFSRHDPRVVVVGAVGEEEGLRIHADWAGRGGSAAG